MYALTIGRAYPDEETGMMGIFEFEQAVALSNIKYKSIYSFCDTRSIIRLRRYGYINMKKSDVTVYGYHLPIGGTPHIIFSKIKKMYYERLLKKIIKNAGIPDVIYIHFPLLTLTDDIWDLFKSLKRPIVVTEHWSKVQAKELTPLQHKLLRKIVNEADKFICVGDLLKKSVIELTNTPKDIQVIPNMVSSMFFYEKQDIKNNNFEFIAIGRLVDSKKFDLVIDAFTKAFRSNANVYLTIVGDGPLFSKYKKQIEHLGMQDRISMVGFLSREETANLLRKSDAFVSGSVLETFGVPFIEAMACGKPVIGIKNGPIDKYINMVNGVLFEKNNFDDLVRALINVYENREMYDGKLISETAMKLFSEETVINELNEIFINCIENYS